MTRTATTLRLLVWAVLLLVAVRQLLPGEQLRTSLHYASMVTCRRLAHAFGAAGIRAELAYRQAVTDGSLAD